MSALALIPPPPIQSIPLGPLDVAMYGLIIAVGAYLALRLTVRRYAASGGDPDIAERAALLGLLGGFLGARIGYVIPRFLGEDGFVGRPQDILAIWQGGLAFFGGLVGGALFVIVYLRVKGVGLPLIADAFAPAVPLAQAFGRWGNYFNQELFGRPTDLPWALQVDPEPAQRAGYPDDTTFHPTFLYESLWNLGLVWVILELDRRGTLRRRGSLFFVYLIGYGAGRGWVEALRVDTVERYLGLSRNNWIAIAVVLLGIAGLMWWERRADAPLRHDPDPEVVEASLPVDVDADADADDGTIDGGPTDGSSTDTDPDASDLDGPEADPADTDPAEGEVDPEVDDLGRDRETDLEPGEADASRGRDDELP